MLLSKSPIITRRMQADSVNSVARGLYPIGFTLEDYLDLYFHVHSLTVSGFSAHEVLILDDTGTFLIPDTQVSAIGGTTLRRMFPIGTLNDDGTELSNSRKPKTALPYPHHSLTGTGFLTIDFGKTLFYGGLYYPEILLIFANGDGSNEAGNYIGGFIFDDFGVIPIYQGASEDLVLIAVADGTISVRERYSDLGMSSLIAGAGDSIALVTSADTASYLNEVDSVFLGKDECNFSVNSTAITIDLPSRARTGRFTFESDLPYNQWSPPIEIRI